MNLDPDLLRILNVNAKVYSTQLKKQGKVVSVSADLVIIDYGNKAKPDTQEYDIEDFSQMLVEDKIVANSRLTMDSRDNFQIKPRVKSPQSVNMTSGVKSVSETVITTSDSRFLKSELSGPQPDITNRQPAEVGYINFPTGNFSTEAKKGYTRIEYRKCVEKVTLELTSEQMEQIRELGLIK